MPIHYKVLKVKTFLVVEVLPEAKRCLDTSAELAALMLTLAAVDYMAGFYAGHQSKNADFKDFVAEYFPKEYRPFLDPLYDQIRSGLMHNLVVSNPWKGEGVSLIIHPNSKDHLTKNADGKIVFSISYFLEDTRRAWWKYQYDLIMKDDNLPNLVINFNRRFNMLDGRGAFMERVPD